MARLVRALGRTAAQHAAFTQAIAAQLGVAPSDLECLAVLQDLGPASAGQLAEVLGLTTGAVTGVIDRLASAGFVVRESDPADRRRVIVEPLADGLARVEERYAPLVGALTRALGGADLRGLLEFEHAAAHALREQTAQLKATETRGSTSFSAQLGDATVGLLEFTDGAADVRIAARAREELLYEASFEGPQPRLRAEDGRISVRYARISMLDWSRAKLAGTVLLNPLVAWRIAILGGASSVRLDGAGLRLQEFKVCGGASKLDLALPLPAGEVKVCLEGGLNRVDIQLPADTAVQLHVHGGANRLEFDGQRFGAVGGDVRLATRGWEQATDRYAIDARGGASRLAVHQ
jgi:DNA-binding MarR family transcriptional regulator